MDWKWSPRKSDVLGSLLIVGLCAAVYWPVIEFSFVRWDDDINYTRNPLLTEPWSWDLFARLFQSGETLRFRPLHWFLVRLLYGLRGFDPQAWHVFGLVLHLVSVGLFLSVLRCVLRRFCGGGGMAVAFASGLGAALWALHPLRAEPVAWATASTYGLTALCLLGSFRCYLEANPMVGSRADIHRGWMAAACLFAFLGFASYPVGGTFPLWLLAVDRWLLRIGPRPNPVAGIAPQSGWWMKHAFFLLPACVAVGLTLWTRVSQPGIFGAAPSIESVGVPIRLLMSLASAGYLVKVLVWPGALTPNMPGFSMEAGHLVLVSALALVMGVTAWWAWRNRVDRPHVALVVLGTGLLALPVLGLTERPSWPVDRYSHLVHLPLCGALAAGVVRVGRMSGRAVAISMGIGTLLVATSAIAVHRQVLIWRNSESLFSYLAGQPGFPEGKGQSAQILILWAFTEAEAGHIERSRELMTAARKMILDAIDDSLAQSDYAEALALTDMLNHHFSITPVMRREKGAWLLHLGLADEALVELEAAAKELGTDARLADLLRQARTLAAPARNR